MRRRSFRNQPDRRLSRAAIGGTHPLLRLLGDLAAKTIEQSPSHGRQELYQDEHRGTHRYLRPPQHMYLALIWLHFSWLKSHQKWFGHRAG